ncbi:hypothetical protein OUZ56_017547 [Daphnia magna]|uniref:Uncharacterized protein n=1 Tax=Daphnia magna TaxID=35525 RepID=A0ABR0AT18_9CRUS|nr:hypothetical protein OUZ56_017547 [Daphnia magna]
MVPAMRVHSPVVVYQAPSLSLVNRQYNLLLHGGDAEPLVSLFFWLCFCSILCCGGGGCQGPLRVDDPTGLSTLNCWGTGSRLRP